jgi:plasmid stability protein
MTDSRPDTYAHIQEVQRRIFAVVAALLARAARHDRSKLVSPEVEAFDEYTPKLAGLTYGSEEYRATLREMQPAIQHHYAANTHHPEHFPEGIAGMNLLDVVEMLCDWKAASLRHPDGDLRASIALNQARFGFSDELRAILVNTVDLLENAP